LDLALDANLPRQVPASSGRGPVWALVGALAAGAMGAASLAGLSHRRQAGEFRHRRIAWPTWLIMGLLLFVAIGAYLANDGLTAWLYGLHTMWMFMIALLFGVVVGAVLGGVMEVTLIRPLHDRPIYYLMVTLGLGVVGIELVQALWGRTEFTVPRPALFRGAGPGCPATDLASWLQNHCSTILVFGGRVRVYEEIFVIIVGLVVLVAVTLLLQRTRLGMIIRAGVQDSQMVEALGINVRRVFTLVFALGVALAVLGGVVAGPRMGLSPAMGESLLLLSLIAMAIGGLTSFPGAAVGSLLVGLLQQFITEYSGVGIKLPFLAEPFKPTPPLVPASTVLLMVIILLVLPQGLLGRKE
jgi:branched-chain amino acid transport system permease protein